MKAVVQSVVSASVKQAPGSAGCEMSPFGLRSITASALPIEVMYSVRPSAVIVSCRGLDIPRPSPQGGTEPWATHPPAVVSCIKVPLPAMSKRVSTALFPVA